MADVFMVKDALDAGMTPQQIQQYVAENGLQADTSGVAGRHASFARRLQSPHSGQTMRMRQTLSLPQMATKTVADALPGALSGVGAVTGFGGGASAGGLGAIPGTVWGGTQGALLGQGGKEALYGLAGLEPDTRPLQTAARYAGAGLEGMANGLMQGFGGQPARGLAVGAMKSAVGNAQPLVEEKMVERGIPATRAGLMAARKAIQAAKEQKRALIAWATGPDGVRVSWRHFRETLAGASRRAAESDPLSMANEQAINKALSIARHKMSTIFAQSARARGEAPFVAAGSEDAVLTPKQVEAIRKYAADEVTAYERIRMGKDASAAGSQPSPMEGAYRALAERAQTILNQMTDPVTGRSLESINKDIGDHVDIHRAITGVLKRGGHKDALLAGAGALPGAMLGTWRHDPAAMALGTAAPVAIYAATNPGLKSQMALNLARRSAARGAAAQAIPQAAGAAAALAGLGDPRRGRGVTTYTSPDQPIQRRQ